MNPAPPVIRILMYASFSRLDAGRQTRATDSS
jgi:hypothetical protein